VRPKGLCQWTNPITASGIKSAAFWLVAQCFNQLCHRKCTSSPHKYSKVEDRNIFTSFQSVRLSVMHIPSGACTIFKQISLTIQRTKCSYCFIQGVSFVFFAPNTIVLAHRSPSSAGTLRNICAAQDSDERNALFFQSSPCIRVFHHL
jgi:hypothetical protein